MRSLRDLTDRGPPSIADSLCALAKVAPSEFAGALQLALSDPAVVTPALAATVLPPAALTLLVSKLAAGPGGSRTDFDAAVVAFHHAAARGDAKLLEQLARPQVQRPRAGRYDDDNDPVNGDDYGASR